MTESFLVIPVFVAKLSSIRKGTAVLFIFLNISKCHMVLALPLSQLLKFKNPYVISGVIG